MSSVSSNAAVLSFKSLKEKHRALRAGFPQELSLRVHRALSWLDRAEREPDDGDVRFILLWIGFNAAYANDVRTDADSEKSVFKAYFDSLVRLDPAKRIYGAVWSRYSSEIRVLLNNKFVFAPFWDYHNGAAEYRNWPERLATAIRLSGQAVAAQDTPRVLGIVFDRLYVLRNQLVHGGATWNGSLNRDQVRDGAAILGFLLPIFVDIMMDNPHADWGRPHYPIVE